MPVIPLKTAGYEDILQKYPELRRLIDAYNENFRILEMLLNRNLLDKTNISDNYEKYLQTMLQFTGPVPTGWLQGFIDTVATSINAPTSRLRWNDQGITAEQTDAQGNFTGHIVRLTAGGIGISSDGGATYQTAMTGAGIVANVIATGRLHAGVVHIGAATTFDPGYGPTQTIIDGGLITTGTIQFKDSWGETRAGVTAATPGNAGIRMWAGATFENRESAPFRVTQEGALVATNATISGSIAMTGGSISWTNVAAPSYGQVTGTKPPLNADNTWNAIGESRLTHITSTGIYTGTIVASQITVGTLTGFLIRTATSGQRVEIDSQHNVRFFNTNGQLHGFAMRALTGTTADYWQTAALYANGNTVLTFNPYAGFGGMQLTGNSFIGLNASSFIDLFQNTRLWGALFFDGLDYLYASSRWPVWNNGDNRGIIMSHFFSNRFYADWNGLTNASGRIVIRNTAGTTVGVLHMQAP